MVVETDPGGQGEIGTDSYEHLSPSGVLDVEVVLLDPASFQLQVPTAVFADGVMMVAGSRTLMMATT